MVQNYIAIISIEFRDLFVKIHQKQLGFFTSFTEE